MKRIIVKSVYDAFDYVMEHYYPAGLEEFGERKDSYAVISIQDTHTKGFGFEFKENVFCKGVLTLYFDDIDKRVDGAVLFSEEQAREIIEFAKTHVSADTLLIHCFGGLSRSWAVGAFLTKIFGGDNSKYFEKGKPNRYVYKLLEETWKRMKKEKV